MIFISLGRAAIGNIIGRGFVIYMTPPAASNLLLTFGMKTTTEVIFLVEESSEGGYEARAIGESIFTEGEDLVELKKNVKEAVVTHFEEDRRPAVIRLHFVREELITV